MHNTHFKDAIKSKCKKIALFTFWTGIFVKYDILTEYLTWFAMLVNEYKLEMCSYSMNFYTSSRVNNKSE
jgi:hypothetical protein